MGTRILELLQAQPVMLLFAVLGIGYLLGKVRLWGFEPGPVSGVLFAGLVFGHFGFEASPTTQSMGFALFIFSVGLQAGPKFFHVLRTDGAKYLSLAVVIAGTGFGIALLMSRLFVFAPGASAGILAGGLTSSPTLAAAQEAVRRGEVPVPEGFTAEARTSIVSPSITLAGPAMLASARVGSSARAAIR